MMLQIEQNKNLKNLNTFSMDVFCDFYVEIKSIEEIFDLIKNPIYNSNKKLILGGGSNMLFTKDYKGIVIKNGIKGITIVSENESFAYIKAGSGEVWHEFVVHCIENNLGGLENLSLIPGCVGASPMQNIGAYGVEIKDTFHELTAIDLISGEKKTFSKEECEFGYRESVFKRKFKDKFIITDVTFKLKKHPTINTSYGAINEELEKMGIKHPSIKDVSKAVINIRQSKLPDPKEYGNAGSFFKNPEVSAAKYNELKIEFPTLVAYPLENGNYKLAAGWLIEQCGLKGFEMNGAAIHDKQALVIINRNKAKGSDVFALSDYVLTKVFGKFGVQLEREVNII